MKNAFVSMVFLFSAILCANADGVIRAFDRGRVWQTVLDADEPITWRWCDGAAAATVTTSNLLTHAVSEPMEVVRGDGNYGSVSLDFPDAAPDSGEALIDVSLVQRGAEESVVDMQTARLAYLPGSEGNGITVDRPGRIRKFTAARPIAYDSMWTNLTADAKSASYSFAVDGATVEESLVGTGGYFAVGDEEGLLNLNFGEHRGVWFANLVRIGGLAIIFR